MRFFSEHRFQGISLASFEQLFFDEAFNEAMCKAVRIERQVQSHKIEQGVLQRAVFIYPDRQVPAPIAKFTGNKKIGYCERLRYTFGQHNAAFVCESTVMPERVTTEGTIELIAQGKDVIRRVEGEVRVKAFGIGSVIERFIVSDVESGYHEAALFTEQYIQEHRIQ